jgi:predicted  nucleic acid-binding Zn-ribbon protein
VEIKANFVVLQGQKMLHGIFHEITARKLAEDEIKNLNAELEQRVTKRTAELTAKTAELERINKVFVDRELRMRELKERIAELEGIKDVKREE